MSSKGPQCPDTNRVWIFFADNPVENIEWIVQGTHEAADVWDAVDHSGLPREKKAHPLVVVWASEHKTVVLDRAIEPKEDRLVDLLGLMDESPKA